jgi:hypothetical protein
MKYSNIVLTDDNFDEELEKLCDFVKINTDSYNSFVKTLSYEFIIQYNEEKEEWINNNGVYPSKGSGFKQAYQRGQLAYEYGNGFIILDYEVLL